MLSSIYLALLYRTFGWDIVYSDEDFMPENWNNPIDPYNYSALGLSSVQHLELSIKDRNQKSSMMKPETTVTDAVMLGKVFSAIRDDQLKELM